MFVGMNEFKGRSISYFCGPRFPFKKLEFLQKVKVKNFVESHVVDSYYSRSAYRILDTHENRNPDQIFYVIGQSHRCQGRLIKDNDEGNYLHEMNRHFVVKLQGGMNITKLALLEDIIELEE